ncbi:hypothetical protein WS98_21225 [Burkholderia territorii]|nr:hypothetical protein WS98_21225 [Burkholderia territorii]
MIAVDVEVDSEVIELVDELRPVDSDEMPVDVEVDSEATELLVELRPVDNELMPVEVDVDSELIELVADERPVDVEVDSEATELLVELRPVDNDVIPVDSDAMALPDVDTVVDREFTTELVAKSCEPLIASVLVAVIRPAATLVT